MATNYKTPGVYIQESEAFPPSVVGVDTAVPAFIGYTAIATDIDGRSLQLIPRQIRSMTEFETVFGGRSTAKYYLSSDAPATAADRDRGFVSLDGVNRYHLVQVGETNFNLYDSMRLFYANGGGTCYVCSCGLYETNGSPTPLAATDMTDALAAFGSITGPTMLAIPDAVGLGAFADFTVVAMAMLRQCHEMGDRMALLDVWGADAVAPRTAFDDTIDTFRNGLAATPAEMLRYGAAYFPSLVTSVVQPGDVDMASFDLTGSNRATLVGVLTAIVAALYPAQPGLSPATPSSISSAALSAKGTEIMTRYVDRIGQSVANDTLPTPAVPKPLTHRALTNALIALVPGFSELIRAIAATRSVLPPSGAMAGVWTTNDTLYGVWNAPANTGIAGMIGPNLQIDDDRQESLTAPTNGLSINAIRTFQGRGSLIWGARTLDGLSNDWRYIQVRRTMIYVEQSVRGALQQQVFKPNTAQTWAAVVSMIESFLHGLWTSGGLMGPHPQQAYSVRCGLGSTMTPDDVLNGVMRVQMTLQMVHPAEGLELTFKQQMLGGS